MKRVIITLCILCTAGILSSAEGQKMNDITITILYDNYTHTEGTTADWGFSCLIEGTDKVILFDTGTKPEVFQGNIKVLGVDQTAVELAAISHNHYDHIGGLASFLERNNDVTLFLPDSFPDDVFESVKKAGVTVKRITGPAQMCDNVYLTGEMGTSIIEQSLILDTPNGLFVITGCAHPGIAGIVKKAEELHKKEILGVIGGFHLGSTSENEVREIIGTFRDLGVVYAGATHCTGEKAIGMFREEYGDHFLQLGVGRVLKITEDGVH